MSILAYLKIGLYLIEANFGTCAFCHCLGSARVDWRRGKVAAQHFDSVSVSVSNTLGRGALCLSRSSVQRRYPSSELSVIRRASRYRPFNAAAFLLP